MPFRAFTSKRLPDLSPRTNKLLGYQRISPQKSPKAKPGTFNDLANLSTKETQGKEIRVAEASLSSVMVDKSSISTNKDSERTSAVISREISTIRKKVKQNFNSGKIKSKKKPKGRTSKIYKKLQTLTAKHIPKKPKQPIPSFSYRSASNKESVYSKYKYNPDRYTMKKMQKIKNKLYNAGDKLQDHYNSI